MTFCHLLLALTLAALFLALVPLLFEALRGTLRELLGRYCETLCRLWIWLAFLAGLVLGALLFCCREELAAWWGEGWCRRTLLLAFLVLLWLLFRYLRWLGRCGIERLPRIDLAAFGLSLGWLVVLLLLLLLALLWMCCSELLTLAGGGWSTCHTLLLLLVLLLVLAGWLRYLAEMVCGDSKDCKGLELGAWQLVVWLALLLVLVFVCCDELADEDFDLAMVGIWWKGGYEGEAGFHLRWSFRHGLTFPEQGFDLERRESNGGTWETVNADRIFPVTEWGTAPPVGEMWIAQGIERLHEDSWSRFEDVPFDELLDTLARAPYDELFYVEEPDPPVAVMPSNPYPDEASRDAYLDTYYALDPNLPALGTWSMEPMTTLEITALFPEMSRLLGLYYIDREADPDIEYDYRVVGYWNDRTRSYTVSDLSRPGTVPLGQPALTRADTPVDLGNVGGVDLIDDRQVALAWTPPTEDPDDLVGPIDIIDSVVFHVEHKPLEALSGGACPASTPVADFAPIDRLDEEGQRVEAAPVTVIAEEDETTGDLFWPQYYYRDMGRDYGCQAYRVLGQDVFGRPSPYSLARIVSVDDLTGPPPPTLVQSTFYQRDDLSLPDAVRNEHFPATGSNQFALVVSWVWPDHVQELADDVKELRIHLQHTGYDTFVVPDDPNPAWRSHGSWELHFSRRIAFADTQPMPDRYTSLPQPVAGRYYETAFTDTDVTIASLGLDADDDTPVEHAWVGVSAVDRDPYNNEGPVSAPVLVLGRDLVPPDPPDPPPALLGRVFPADESGNRSLRLGWPGDDRYTYTLHRVDVSDLTLGGPFTLADLVDCPAVTEPTCDPADDACAEELADFQIRATLVVDPSPLQRVSALPLEVGGTDVETSDTVDGTVSRRYVYAATAIDPAGNESELSCPSEVILVEDGVPPRTPVITSTLGEDGAIAVTWALNPDPDLARYTLYRTAVEENARSRRRMVEVAAVCHDASSTSCVAGDAGGAGAYQTRTWHDGEIAADTTYLYRLDAVDLAGNRSPLSEIVTARAFDATPPDPPEWEASPLTLGTDGDGKPQVTLRWQAVAADPDLSILVQRRETGTPLWRARSEWLAAGTLEHIDGGLRAGESYDYRVRAMDPSGNRGDWSDVETVAVPP